MLICAAPSVFSASLNSASSPKSSASACARRASGTASSSPCNIRTPARLAYAQASSRLGGTDSSTSRARAAEAPASAPRHSRHSALESSRRVLPTRSWSPASCHSSSACCQAPAACSHRSTTAFSAARPSWSAARSAGVSAFANRSARSYCAAASRCAASSAARRAAAGACRRTASRSPAPSAWWASRASSRTADSCSASSTDRCRSVRRCAGRWSSTAIRAISCRNRNPFESEASNPVVRQPSIESASWPATRRRSGARPGCRSPPPPRRPGGHRPATGLPGQGRHHPRTAGPSPCHSPGPG